ncbi:MAG TPA: NusG domain II-containing protein [Eubacteriales bacterium]|nr:NusG domain II-containing protein [Clostridia bacterium]HRR89796.1 NusG domain II-containing protein [Eubacteriales bacterium]HRU84012.1 NusG domain II-containing protein [Eubacteriales bacterium]
MKAEDRINEIKSSKPFRWGDFLLLAVVLALIGLAVWLAVPKAGNTVEIYESGKLVYSLPLSEDREVDVKGDGKFIVKIEEGKVFVKTSDCPNQDCVHSAPIKSGGGVIICLPNEIVIKITATDIDAIT